MNTTTKNNVNTDHVVLPVSLRDYFAAKAMQGLITGHFSHYGHENYWPRDGIAQEAYEMADAMVEERNKK